MATNFRTPAMGTLGATWEYGGYNGCGNVVDILGSLNECTVIVAGNARGVFNEVSVALSAYPRALVFAVNDVGIYLPKVDHWISLHYDNFRAWRAVRWLTKVESFKSHSIVDDSDFDYSWNGLSPMFALSGYFAMQIAHLMGAAHIILCGCPGDGTPRFFEANSREDFEYGGGDRPQDKNVRQQLVNEMNRLPHFKSKVRSMSGWTAEYFGTL